jgi:hypothetical protein
MKAIQCKEAEVSTATTLTAGAKGIELSKVVLVTAKLKR